MPDLAALAETHLAAALAAPNGRSTELVVHDHQLRQTVIALADGQSLAEHNAPPAATIQVLRGSVQVTSQGGDDVVVREGELMPVTHERHGVLALEDSAFLLTTVTGIPEGTRG
ncbi:cupin [Cellulomonas sp. ATA003]|uniref:cupin n=1 Tax=Cellulomonas sp. ATA003 TaxID=3073064 RepID=UPI002873332E|nr:cupin [Cellulomonas sp. ATA003]WNB84354.1 cupin [Cellulomonas sp. ATA003]